MFCLPDDIKAFGLFVVMIEGNETEAQTTEFSTEDQRGYESGLNT